MSGDVTRRSFASRPRDPEAWVRTPEAAADSVAKAGVYTARLTVDITPELRGRIKIAAFGRGLTVADMLRDMLEAAFPNQRSDRP